MQLRNSNRNAKADALTSNKISKSRIIIIALIIVLLIVGILSLFTQHEVHSINIQQLPVAASISVIPFGDQILCYDNQFVHCLTKDGIERWTYYIDADAGMHADDEHVVLWRNNSIAILDKNGNSSYQDTLGDVIRFARIGKQYVGIVLDENYMSTLSIRDLTGAKMDEESEGFSNTLLLDLGFFGSSGEYLWTLKLDTDSTVQNTVLNTFEVGKMNTGEVSLGEYITYKVLFENNRLRVVNTRFMKSYDYRISNETLPSVLTYGWQLIDSFTPDSTDGLMLFAPSNNLKTISELRIIGNNVDSRYSLPSECYGACIFDKTLYAFSSNTVFSVDLNGTHYTSHPLPIENGTKSLICKLNDNNVVVSDGTNLYTITLP